jgi:hypothetical protein
MSVHVGEQFYNDARVISEVQTHSIDQQIEHWGEIGKIAEGNPVLSYAAIKSILIGMQQSKAGDLGIMPLAEAVNEGSGEPPCSALKKEDFAAFRFVNWTRKFSEFWKI